MPDESKPGAPGGGEEARMTPESLRAYLERAWSAETSVDPTWWSPDRPSLGQCAVTAMLVEEYVDGAPGILRVVLANGVSHYFNEGPVDLTRDQFDVYEPIGEPEPRTFRRLVTNPDTHLRWFILRSRLLDLWSDD